MRRQFRGKLEKAVFRVVKNNTDRLNALINKHIFYIIDFNSASARQTVLLMLILDRCDPRAII